MLFSKLKQLVRGYIYSADGDSIGLDGHFTIQELEYIIKYMTEYQEGNEDL